MRPVREITAAEERLRLVPLGPFATLKRDPVEPEPIGTIILAAFRITGYDPDCDGSLMARMESIDKDGGRTGAEHTHVGLYPECDLVVTLDELRALFDGAELAALRHLAEVADSTQTADTPAELRAAIAAWRGST